jgi:hypothetical protein
MSTKTITLLALCLQTALAQDITFTNQTATFTNLEGRVFKNVTLVRATDYGIVWKGDGMGMVSYTNLSPTFLTSLGIGYERVQQAKALLARKQPKFAATEPPEASVQASHMAEWQADRERDAHETQRQAAQAQIQTLAAQIATAERQLKVDQANTADLNASSSQYYFTINKSKRELAIEDAKAQLATWQREFAAKYNGTAK